jgi:threonyl-tRNA synthetase
MQEKDHREIGKKLKLFFFDERIGNGLPVYTERGSAIKEALLRYIHDIHIFANYKTVSTPHIATESLFRKSGHLTWYEDSIYPPINMMDEGRYFLKPMNCPFHAIVYSNSLRSYRELPIKLFEFGTIYRYEASGGLYGLTRVRGITQDDAHIFCKKEEALEMVCELVTMIIKLIKLFQMELSYIELSTYNKKRGDHQDKDWNEAIALLKNAISTSSIDSFKYDNEGAAFYGPKISFQIRDNTGKDWQLSTIQLDLQMAKNFELTYKDKSGALVKPFVIHRALFGSIERFIGLLLEHTGGALPAWLASTQLFIVPISNNDIEYAENLRKLMHKNLFRVELLVKNITLSKKLNHAYANKAPYIVIVGKQNREKDMLTLVDVYSASQRDLPYEECVKILVEKLKAPSIAIDE